MKESYLNYKFLLFSGSAHLVFRLPLLTVYWLEPCDHCRQDPHVDGPRGRNKHRSYMAPLSPACLCQPQSPKINVPTEGTFYLSKNAKGHRLMMLCRGRGWPHFYTGARGGEVEMLNILGFSDVWYDLQDTMVPGYYIVKHSVALLFVQRQWMVLIR